MFKRILRIVIMTALLLLIPLLGKWPWTLSDFIIAGILLLGAGLTFELIARNVKTNMYRVATGSAVATGLLLMWSNLAVGLIGNENNPANLMYFGVIAIGLIGAAVARFKPHGMARTLFATALAQAMVPIIAMLIWRPSFDFGMVQVLGVNAFFMVLWIGSALLFQKASMIKSK